MNETTIKKQPTPPPADARLLKLEEVAYVLRISPRSVRRMIGKGEISAVAVTSGRATLRVTRDEVDRFIRDQRVITGSPDANEREESEAARKKAASLRVKASWNTGEDPFASRSRKPPKSRG